MDGVRRSLTLAVLILIVSSCLAAVPPNGFAPAFTKKIYSVSTPEDVVVGKILLQVSATDRDLNSVVTYDFISPQPAFSINRSSGEIRVSQTLDRETQPVFRLPVTAFDNGIPPRSGRALVSITVRDANDNRPVFSPSSYSAQVDDSAPVGHIIRRLTCTDDDYAENAELSYSIVSGEEINSTFTVTSNGDVILVRKLDFTRRTSYNVTIQAIDLGDDPLTSSNNATVFISVVTRRYVIPQFDESLYNFTVSEDVGVPHVLGEIRALHFNPDTDSDLVVYSIDSGNSAGTFHLSLSGNLTLVKSLDREAVSLWELVVSATDSQNSSLTNSTVVRVSVLDINDNYPRLIPSGSLDVTITENAAVNQSLIAIDCTDDDLGPHGTVMLSLLNSRDMFSLSNKAIVLKRKPDITSNSTFTLTAQCSDFGHPRLTSQTQVHVHVVKVNTYPPVFGKSRYVSSVLENSNIDTAVATVSAMDRDRGDDGKFSFSLSGSHGVFRIDPLNGTVYTAQSLDREKQEVYVFKVVATDRGVPQQSGSAQLTVTVLDVNDNVPQCERTVYDAPVSEHAGDVLDLNCTDVDENSVVMYQLMEESNPGVFGVNASGFVVVRKDLAKRASANYWLKIQVFDASRVGQQQMVNVNVSVHVIRHNDYTPSFSHGSPIKLDISEQTRIGTTVTHVTAIDGDIGPDGDVHYSLIGGTGILKFGINSTNGGIQLQKSLVVADGDSTVTLIVQATDQAVAPQMRKTSTIEVTINVYFNPKLSLTAKSVRVWRSAEVGMSVVSARCVTADVNGAGVMFNLQGLQEVRSVLSVDSRGNVEVKASLHDLHPGNYSITVLCQDSQSRSSNASFILTLLEDVTVTPPVGTASGRPVESTNPSLSTSHSSIRASEPSPESASGSVSETLVLAIVGAVCGILVIVLVIMVTVIIRWKREHGYVCLLVGAFVRVCHCVGCVEPITLERRSPGRI